MSTFAVEFRKIKSLVPHWNAERLDIAQVEGLEYQFIVTKGKHFIGEEVIYFPLDSILPDNILEKIGLSGKLSGANKNRVKTIKLRQEISQGLVCKLEEVLSQDFNRTIDLTSFLGVLKFEPEEEGEKSLNLRGQRVRIKTLPEGCEHYDIESCDRHKAIMNEELLNVPVYISEKLEGSNFAMVRKVDGTIIVCTRNHSVIPIENDEDSDHPFIATAKEMQLYEFVEKLSERYPDVQIILRGEFIGPGVQKNIYKLAKHEIRLFDIKIRQEYLDAAEFLQVAPFQVPMISFGITLREYLGERDIRNASNGKSLICDTMREGIVVKPLIEKKHPKLGRLVLKQRSPEYLCKSDT